MSAILASPKGHDVRGRRERELEPHRAAEDSLGATLRAWRHVRGLSVTELAVRAGFGPNGRGYISKIEHGHIQRLSGPAQAALAHALDLSPLDLQQRRLPAEREHALPAKETLDDAIAGCRAWLRLYRQDDKRLDSARTHFKLAELYWARLAHADGQTERGTLLDAALQSINQALALFSTEAPDSSEQAQHLRRAIERAIVLTDLDDAITGCNALLTVSSQEQNALDWARTQIKLAQLYWDRTTSTESPQERSGFFALALQSIDQALPIFQQHAPVSYTEAQHMRQQMETAHAERA